MPFIRAALTLGWSSLLLASLTAPSYAALITLDFEDVEPGPYGGCSRYEEVGDCAYAEGALVTHGFVLDPGGVDWSPVAQTWIGHYQIADASSAFNSAHNGTRSFVFDYFFDYSALNVYSLSGEIFGVRQLDLAERGYDMGTCHYSTEWWYAYECGVTFIGQLVDGGTITRGVILDGVADGAGLQVDFETFTFDHLWDRLTMFSIVANHQYLNPALDNLVLRTVPEPSTIALLVLGLAAFRAARRS